MEVDLIDSLKSVSLCDSEKEMHEGVEGIWTSHLMSAAKGQIPQLKDLTDLLTFALNHEPSLAKINSLCSDSILEKYGDNKLARFFQILLSTAKEKLPPSGQPVDEKYLGLLAQNLSVSYLKKVKSDYKIRQEYLRGEELFQQEKSYRQALFAYNDVLLALLTLPLTFEEVEDDLLHMCNWSSRQEDRESCSSGVSSNDTAEERECEECGQVVKLPRSMVLLRIKLRQLECIFKDNQFRNVETYATALLDWMLRIELKSQVFLVQQDAEAFFQVLDYLIKAMIHLDNVSRAIVCYDKFFEQYFIKSPQDTMDKSYFKARDSVLAVMSESLQGGTDCCPPEVAADRASAKIIVQNGGPRGYVDGQFRVQDLESALRIAKDGDMIFLEPGVYCGKLRKEDSPSKWKPSERHVLEIYKAVTICGSNARDVIIRGSLVKWGKGNTTFVRVTLEIGQDKDDSDNVYIMEGYTQFAACHIKAPVNTAFYVIGHSAETSCDLVFRYCLLDGMDTCYRFVAHEGPKFKQVLLHACLVRNMYSFLTVIDTEYQLNGHIRVEYCNFLDVQDGFKLVIHHESQCVSFYLGCQMDLVLKDQDALSHGFSQTGGKCIIKKCTIHGKHTDFIGISLHSLKDAHIANVLIDCIPELHKQVALSEGISGSENKVTTIANCKTDCLRLGYKLSNAFMEEFDVCVVKNCSAYECSVGFLIGERSQDECCPEVLQGEANMHVTLSNFEADTCHYGLMNQCKEAIMEVTQCTFTDVAKPIILSKASIRQGLEIGGNVFKFPLIDDSDDDDEAEEAIRKKMYCLFALHKNLPLRLAYERGEFVHISSEKQQMQFKKQQGLLPDSALNSSSNDD